MAEVGCGTVFQTEGTAYAKILGLEGIFPPVIPLSLYTKQHSTFSFCKRMQCVRARCSSNHVDNAIGQLS